jgi:hypothetical protein
MRGFSLPCVVDLEKENCAVYGLLRHRYVVICRFLGNREGLHDAPIMVMAHGHGSGHIEH